MHLNIVKSKNALQYYVLESYRKENGKNSTRIVRKLGTHEQLLKEHPDPEAWARSVVTEMNREAEEGKQRIVASFSVNDATTHSTHPHHTPTHSISHSHHVQYSYSTQYAHTLLVHMLHPTPPQYTWVFIMVFSIWESVVEYQLRMSEHISHTS